MRLRNCVGDKGVFWYITISISDSGLVLHVLPEPGGAAIRIDTGVPFKPQKKAASVMRSRDRYFNGRVCIFTPAPSTYEISGFLLSIPVRGMAIRAFNPGVYIFRVV